MKTFVVVLALLLSSASLALQFKKSAPIPFFEKFMGPARLSDFDLRVLRAELYMTRDAIDMRNGIGVPFVRQLSDDHRRVTLRAIVSEESLPKDHGKRKSALLFAAYSAVAAIASDFDLPIDDKSTTQMVRVEFVSMEDMVKSTNSQNPNIYAEFTDGELTFQ